MKAHINDETGYRPGPVWKGWYRQTATQVALISRDPELLQVAEDDLYLRMVNRPGPSLTRAQNELRALTRSIVLASADALLETMTPSRAVSALDARIQRRMSQQDAGLRELQETMERGPRVLRPIGSTSPAQPDRTDALILQRHFVIMCFR